MLLIKLIVPIVVCTDTVSSSNRTTLGRFRRQPPLQRGRHITATRNPYPRAAPLWNRRAEPSTVILLAGGTERARS